MKFDSTSPKFSQVPRPVFGRAEQHERTRGPTTKANARYQRAAKTAAELLPELPRQGEAIHVLMTGYFDLMQVIAAAMRQVPKCSHLRIATLCFSKRNTAELLGLLDERRATPFRLTMLVSEFFRDHNKELFEKFAADLAGYTGATISAARSHCKVVCFDLGKDDGLAFEGSANLRTNRNREQLTVIRDRTLHDWHAAWIDELTSLVTS